MKLVGPKSGVRIPDAADSRFVEKKEEKKKKKKKERTKTFATFIFCKDGQVLSLFGNQELVWPIWKCFASTEDLG